MTTKRNSESIHWFRTPAAWTAWLEKNHRSCPGLWLRLARKGSDLKSVSYGEALEVALCYGWIDGQKRGESEQTWRQRFLPRSARSVWSKINREKAVALVASGRMHAAGREALDAAKKNGTWDAAYDSPRSAKVPEDFQAALDRSPQAWDFFGQIDGRNRYAILFRIQTAKKAQTRERKIQGFITMLEKRQTIHPAKKTRPKSN